MKQKNTLTTTGRPKGSFKLSPEQIAFLLEEWLAGTKPGKIAQELGVHRRTVTTYASRLGLSKDRPRGRPKRNPVPIRKTRIAVYIPKPLKEEIFEIFDRTCASCDGRATDFLGRKFPLHIDHVKPIAQFPDLAGDITNLQALCAACNELKKDKSIDYRTEQQKDRLSQLALRVEQQKGSRIRVHTYSYESKHPHETHRY